LINETIEEIRETRKDAISNVLREFELAIKTKDESRKLKPDDILIWERRFAKL